MLCFDTYIASLVHRSVSGLNILLGRLLVLLSLPLSPNLLAKFFLFAKGGEFEENFCFFTHQITFLRLKFLIFSYFRFLFYPKL